MSDRPRSFVVADLIDIRMEKAKQQPPIRGRMECPWCKGEESIEFAVSENGHRRARCDNGCVAFME